MQLEGNTIFITGATSGIGLAFAEAFLGLGNKVIVCGRRADKLNELAGRHEGLITYTADVGKQEEREQLARRILTDHPDVNVLMNNAGVQYYNNLAQRFEYSKAEEEVSINLLAPLHLIALFVEHLKKQPRAAIVNITSGLAYVPISFMPVYCATKAALRSATMSLRHQLKDTTVKVFGIAPPSVNTELGYQNRGPEHRAHGGMPISDFLAEAMEGIKNDQYETLVGAAK